ncbi:hypothetical protein Trydic_g9668 [Trypoxylus dichotomus]
MLESEKHVVLIIIDIFTNKILIMNAHRQAFIHLLLAKQLHPLLWEKIDSLSTYRAETVSRLGTNREKRKLEQLQKKHQPELIGDANVRTVYNLSQKTHTKAAIKVLGKSFNFTITPKHIPVENIICGVQSALCKVEHSKAETIQKVTTIIRKLKPPKRNIIRDEHLALKDIQKDKTIIVLPADKSNATVVLDRTEYHKK